jgi:hypothetical protein
MEIKRRKIFCRSKEKENYGLVYEREKENSMPTAKAGTQSRVPVPSPPPRNGGRRGRRGPARLVEADKAGGSRGGQWGRQATSLMPESTSIAD